MDQEKRRAAIEADLLNQLSRNGTVGEYYTDLVSDYMEMWSAKNDLIRDIKERGTVVDYTSNSGQVNKRKNESVNEFLKVNAQMSKLLDTIGISPSGLEDGEDDDEM